MQGVPHQALTCFRRGPPPRVARTLVYVSSWDSDQPELVVVGPEPWSSHCPKNPEWSSDALDECCRLKWRARPSFLSVAEMRQIMECYRFEAVTAPNKNSFSRSVHGVRCDAWCDPRRVLPP